MIQLYDAETDEPCGTLSEEQFEILADALEEEGPDDRDYYLNVEVADMIESNGLDPELVRVLRKALAGREEMDIRWERV
ncbi:MAG: galactosyldiacylglycerol synthase [Candidatus Rokubacteria bacterium]|nr:galactosyldiacylglycerol synthase [Candidatus Rokubacteria bacterium]